MKLLFLPDIILPDRFKSKRVMKNLENFLCKINKNFNSHEFIINLESVLLQKQTLAISKNNFNIFSNEANFNILLKYNLTNLSLSNNHVFDYGLDGFNQTIEILKKNNVKFFGAGKNLYEAKKPIIFTHKENKCAVFGMSYKPVACTKTPGVFSVKDKKSLNFVKNYKKKK
jgi:poly-gamma-glutamate synthesis protein (capsule biosynthesis protein)